jgi:aminopeptidase N
MTIDEVTFNGVVHDVERLNDEVFVPLQEPVPTGEQFTVTVGYHGSPPTGGFFSGISTSSSQWGKNVTWTLSEPFAARDWWPVKQVLEDKADSVWVFLTTEEENMAGSNGLLTNVVPLPDNKVRYEWKSNYPIAYYLISFAVSEYQEYNVYAHPAELQGDSVLIQNFVYDVPNCLETYKDGIDQTAEFIELFSDLYSLYPFHEEKYGHCLTDLGGGMEHQTMTTIGGFGFWLVAHELGHMWFGDNVTCATWSDIWINEGFATYSEYLALQFIQGQSAANGEMNSLHNSVMSQPGGSVYVPEDEVTYDNVWRIFDGRLSYNKGSVILHMIRFELDDDDIFFQTLHNFQEQFTDSTATGLDFMEVLNETSSMDFTQFFDQWYFGEGYPTYDIAWSQDEAYLYMEVTQSVSMPGVTPVFKMPMEYKFFFYSGGDTTVRLYQTDNVNTFMLPISEEVGLIQVDPNNWVLNKVGTITTSVKETLNPVAFSIAPNPVQNSLNVQFERQSGTEPYTLSIYTLGGTLVESTVQIGNQLTLDLHGLNPGTYFLQVTQGERQFTEKFVKLIP